MVMERTRGWRGKPQGSGEEYRHSTGTLPGGGARDTEECREEFDDFSKA